MSRKSASVVLAISLVVIPFFAVAQPAKAPAFKSLDARRAVTTFEARTKKLNEEHFRALKVLETKFENESQKIRRVLLESLSEAQSKATKTGNLEEAVRLRDAIKEFENSFTGPEQAVEVDIPKDAVVLGGHHYYAVAEGLPWHLARDLCAARGGHLVRIEGQDEMNFLLALMKQGSIEACWLDLNDELKEGDWRFTNGEKTEFFKWTSGPDNHEGAQHYAYMGSSGTWDDAFGGQRLAYICEWDE